MDKLKIKKNGQFIQIPLSAFDNDTHFIDNTYHDNTKVDKEHGKGLSTNDYTTAEKNKLAGIEENANNYILPNDVVEDNNYVHTDNNYTSTEKNKLASLNNYDNTELRQLIADKQDIEDNNLQTQNSEIVPAINEVNSLAKLSNKAKGYVDYSSLITELNSASNQEYLVGQSFLIQTLNVPDLWIISIENSNIPYTYTSDEAFITATSQTGGCQVGYYKLGQLETLKQDLTNYVKNTDYASISKGGVVKVGNYGGFNTLSSGQLYAVVQSYSGYKNASGNYVIAKNTLENVITGKNLVSDADYVHTDNNFDDDYMNKVDYIDDTGDGDYFLSNDGSYYPISSGDIRIPTITITSVTKNGSKYIRLNFGAYSKEFENYVRENGIQIHLFRYKRNAKRDWNDNSKNQEKKWIHPSNQIEPLSEPAKQCWGIGCYKPQIGESEFYNQIDNANYVIPNEGVVQSEFTLNYRVFARGYMEIPFDDIMKCIVKCKGEVGVEQTDMKLPSLNGEYSTELVKIIGGQQSKRRARMHQPIKYSFALPIVLPNGKVKYQYGECTNTAVIELMTKRDPDAGLGYSNGGKGFLPNVYYGLIIR